MKYCKNCNQNVNPTKKFSLGWFIIDCLTIVGGGIYILYYFFFKKKVCPMCHSHNFEHKHDIGETDTIVTEIIPNVPEISLGDKLINAMDSDKQKEKSEKANTAYAESKAKTAETIRKRKAGELPWQIKKEQKRLSKLNKNT